MIREAHVKLVRFGNQLISVTQAGVTCIGVAPDLVAPARCHLSGRMLSGKRVGCHNVFRAVSVTHACAEHWGQFSLDFLCVF